MLNNFFNLPINLTNSIEYSDGSIVSKAIIDKPGVTITLFAFDKGQSLSKHSTPFDALVQILDGEAEIIIDETNYAIKTGEAIIMPANIPHAVKAINEFKMLLSMIKE